MSIQNMKLKITETGITPKTKTNLTYEIVIEQIKKMELDQKTFDALSVKARSMPHGSLQHFMNNIQTHIINTADKKGKNEARHIETDAKPDRTDNA